MKKKPRPPAKPKDMSHEYRDPSFQKQQIITPEIKKAAHRFYSDSYEIERKMLQSRGW